MKEVVMGIFAFVGIIGLGTIGLCLAFYTASRIYDYWKFGD